jgi:hypothetical protein
MPPTPAHKWAFAPRFRRHAFGWRSQPAVQRVKEATAEIQKVAKKVPALTARSAFLFLEKISPAFEQVDSSPGAIDTAVNHAVEACARIIAEAPVDDRMRDQCLDRLWEGIRTTRSPKSNGWATTGARSAHRSLRGSRTSKQQCGNLSRSRRDMPII